MKELWDAYDRQGNRLNATLVRGEPIPEGCFHIVSEVIVRHKNGDFLLMLRDPDKPIHPGVYELTAGGSALAGEDALACVKRELLEETGLRCDDFVPLSVTVRERNHSLFHMFYCEVDCDPDAIRLQPGETVGYKWVNWQALQNLLDGDALVPSTRERIQGYLNSDIHFKA